MSDVKDTTVDAPEPTTAQTPVKEYNKTFTQAEVDEMIKKSISKANSEAAEFKRELQKRMSEDELRSQERERMDKELRDELEVLKKDKSFAEHKAGFISLGFEDELARASAKALQENDMTLLFTNMKQHIDALMKKLAAVELDATATPPNGSARSDGDNPFDAVVKKYEKQTRRI